MEDEEDPDASADVVGLSIDEAAAVVAERADAPDDEDAIAATLRTVSEDGVVSLDAVTDEVSEVSMTLSTAEGRVEYATVELETTREAVAAVDDLAFVRSRLDAFAARAEGLEGEVADLGPALQEQVDRRDDAGRVYDVACELARIRDEADRVQARADRLVADLDEFERVVDDPVLGLDELGADLTALEEVLDDIDATIEDLAAVAGGDATDEAADAGLDPATVWFETSVRHRTNGLVFDDVRAELESLRTLAERQGVEDERADEVGRRLEAVRERWTETGERLDDVAAAAWVEAYGDRLAEVEATVDGFEAPVDWGAVEEAVDAYRVA